MRPLAPGRSRRMRPGRRSADEPWGAVRPMSPGRSLTDEPGRNFTDEPSRICNYRAHFWSTFHVNWDK